MENLSGEWTRLLYCTTGVLLRKLQHDRHLSSLTHIIVDEVRGASRPLAFLNGKGKNLQQVKTNPSISSGSRAQRPVRLPVNHPERCCDEEIGPAAHPHERHSGLPQILHLFQPLPSDHHPWSDLSRRGKRSFWWYEGH